MDTKIYDSWMSAVTVVPNTMQTRCDVSSDSDDENDNEATRWEAFMMGYEYLAHIRGYNCYKARICFLISFLMPVLIVCCVPMRNIDRWYTLLIALFMVSQAFLLVKTIRDAAIISTRNSQGRMLPAYHLLEGAMPSQIALHRQMCLGSLVLTAAASVWGLLTIDSLAGVKVFVSLSWTYLLSSSLHAAWLARDCFEADVWLSEVQYRGEFQGTTRISAWEDRVELAVRNMVRAFDNGLWVAKFMFFLCAAFAITVEVLAVLEFCEGVDTTAKGIGLLCGALVSALAAGWGIAFVLEEPRPVLDFDDPEKWGFSKDYERERKRDERKHKVCASVFLVISLLLVVIALCELRTSWQRKALLFLGMCIALDTTVNFAWIVFRHGQLQWVVDVLKKKFQLDPVDVSGQVAFGGQPLSARRPLSARELAYDEQEASYRTHVPDNQEDSGPFSWFFGPPQPSYRKLATRSEDS